MAGFSQFLSERSLTVHTPGPTPLADFLADLANALRKLTVDDVIAHLGISKPLAYLRFQEAGAGTIANAILKARLAEVAKRLRASETPISHIASQCSFNNLQHLANAFKRQYGQSMTAYRRASQATTSHDVRIQSSAPEHDASRRL